MQIGIMSEAVFGVGPNNRHYTFMLCAPIPLLLATDVSLDWPPGYLPRKPAHTVPHELDCAALHAEPAKVSHLLPAADLRRALISICAQAARPELPWCSEPEFRQRFGRPEAELMEKLRQRVFQCFKIEAKPRQVLLFSVICSALPSRIPSHHPCSQYLVSETPHMARHLSANTGHCHG